MTIIIFIVYYRAEHNFNAERNSSYLPSLIVLLIYGVVTSLQTFEIFSE